MRPVQRQRDATSPAPARCDQRSSRPKQRRDATHAPADQSSVEMRPVLQQTRAIQRRRRDESRRSTSEMRPALRDAFSARADKTQLSLFFSRSSRQPRSPPVRSRRNLIPTCPGWGTPPRYPLSLTGRFWQAILSSPREWPKGAPSPLIGPEGRDGHRGGPPFKQRRSPIGGRMATSLASPRLGESRREVPPWTPPTAGALALR